MNRASALDDVGFPDDAELRAALRAYMEWAVTEVTAYSPKELLGLLADGGTIGHF